MAEPNENKPQNPDEIPPIVPAKEQTTPSSAEIDLNEIFAEEEPVIPVEQLQLSDPDPEFVAPPEAVAADELAIDDVPVGQIPSEVSGTPQAEIPQAAPPQVEIPQAEIPQAEIPQAEAIDLDDEGVDFGATASAHEGASAIIPLDRLPETTGESITSWTEIIRRQRAAAEAAQNPVGEIPVSVDAPSDQDILKRLLEDQPDDLQLDGEGRDTDQLPQSAIPMATSEDLPTSEGELSLEDILPPLPAEGPLTGGSEVRFDSHLPPSDAAGVYQKESSLDEEIPLGASTTSGTEQSSILDALINQPSSFPKANFPPPPPVAKENIEYELANENNATMPQFELPDIDLPEFPQSNVPTSEKTNPFDSVYPSQWMESTQEISDADVELPDNYGTAGDVVDLTSEANIPMPSLTDSGTFEIPPEAVKADEKLRELMESSSVDLSPKPSMTGEFDAITPGSTPMLRPEESGYAYADAVDSDENVVVPAPQPQRRTPIEAPSQKRSPLAVVGAGLLGLVIGAGGFAGAWLGGVLPNNESASITPPPSNNNNDAALAEAKAAAEAAQAQLATLQEQAKLEKQNLTKAQTDLSKAKEELAKAQTAETEANNKLKLAQMAETKAKEDLAAAQKAVEESTTALKAAEKKLEDATKGIETALKDSGADPAKPVEAIAKLIAAKKDAETKQKELTDKLEVATKKELDLQKAVDDSKKALDDAKQMAADVMKAKSEVEGIVKGITDKLEKAKFLVGKADATTIAKALDDAIKAGSTDAVKDLRNEIVALKEAENKAKLLAEAEKKKAESEAKKAEEASKLAMTQMENLKKALDELTASKADVTKLSAQVQALKDAQGNLKSPEQIFDAYLAALSDPAQKNLAEQAKKDAQAILDGKAPAEVTLKAQAVKVLALRNTGDLAGATDLLNQIKGQLPDKVEWAKPLLALANKVSDPLAILKPVESTAPVNELSLIEGALKAFPAESKPKEHAQLLIRRAELSLKDKPEQARQDVTAALKLSPSSEGLNLLGELAERANRIDEAIQAYEQALKLGGSPETIRKIRLNLLNAKRLKLTSPPVDKTSSLDRKIDPQTALIFLLTLVEPVSTQPDLQPLIEEADQMIAQKEYLGHIIKADLLAKMNRHSEALKEYSEGIKKLNVLDLKYQGILDNIVKSHPGLRSPGQEGKPDPESAEKWYGEGLSAFHAHDFKNAIVYFEKAIKANDTDARYRYFLALSLSQTGKKAEAEVEFLRGRELELLNKPTYRTISNSLIRVQGPIRKEINKYRP